MKISSWSSNVRREMELVTRRLHPLLVGAVTVVVASFTVGGVATSAVVEKSATNEIAQSFEVPVTNHADGVTLSNVLTVASATLDTLNPDGSGVSAPAGRIYLSLQVTSGPPQVSTSSPTWGHYFSSMTPVPGGAWRYVASSGIKYAATRVNPVDQTSNPNSSADDGMVDATYYFTVPLSTRAGTIELLPTHTLGVEYMGFVGGTSVVLTIGGPTNIPVRFPKNLTVTTTTTVPSSAPVRGSSGSTLSVVLLVIMLFFIGAFELRRRRRLAMRRRLSPSAPPDQRAPTPQSTAPAPRPQPTPATTGVVVTARPALAPEPAAVENVPRASELRVDILGPLSIAPTLTSPSDPVRAIVAYLAMNTDRALTLDEIQNAIWPITSDGADIKRTVMRNYLSDVRRCIGEDHLPSAAGRPGYQLAKVNTDWDEFQHLEAQAKRLPKQTALDTRLQALALVKGPPFTADTSRYFTWAFSASIVYKIISTVVEVAHEVSAQLVMAGNLKGAEAALRQGLFIEPASLQLWEDLTDVLLETADQSLMEVHWKAAALLLRPEDVSQLRTRENG
jgi:DNA-binding SARP family transcriptional activator